MTMIKLPEGWSFVVNEASLVFKPVTRFLPSVKVLVKERKIQVEEGKRLSPKSSVMPFSGVEAIQELVDKLSILDLPRAVKVTS